MDYNKEDVGKIKHVIVGVWPFFGAGSRLLDG